MNDYELQMAFESDVRRVAEAVFGLAPGECAPAHYANDPVVRELDGIARLRDVTHLIMATVSRRLEKAKEDINKLNAAERLESRRKVATSKWFITKYELNAEHIQLASRNGVKALTLENFRNHFFNGRDYVAKRRVAAFGSARNLNDGSITIDDTEYVELPMVLRPGDNLKAEGAPVDVVGIVDRLTRGSVLVLVAPFGSGKSITARELFVRMSKRYLENQSEVVPVVVNLREHWGQLYGDEVFERHARSIGFSPREDLVAAWRAGVVSLILDGFDELASQVVARADSFHFMREARAKALEAVRDLVLKLPKGSGVLLCGRDHYFDDDREMQHALGLSGRAFAVVRLGEFTEEQALTFLKRHGVHSPLPDWLPRKPLILGYLAHRGLLEEILKIDSTQGFGRAWDRFLDLISEREAEHGRVVMDPVTLRRVLERLACDVRSSPSGTGPIMGFDLAEAYRAETGQVPGEGVLMQLQRLPGLTQREQDPTARSFIDADFLAALQGSALARYVLENVSTWSQRSWLGPLPEKGIAMASHLLAEAKADPATVVATGARVSGSELGRSAGSQVAADCLMIALEMAREAGRLDCHGARLNAVSLGSIDLEDMDVRNLYLDECLIEEVTLGPETHEHGVRFAKCMIARIRGVPAAEGLPGKMFQDCVYAEFDDLSTNAAVLRSDLAPPVKALFTVLRKLFVQAGGGRKLAALRRGMPPGPVLAAVDGVVDLLESENIVSVFQGVAHASRKHASRIHAILNAGSLSNDPLVKKAKRL